MSELATIQRWLTSIIVRPGSLIDKIQLADHHYKLENNRVIRQSERLSATEKIEIYSRGYFLRLLECMDAEYPALKNLLGEELFQTFIRAYLIQQPPISPDLFNLGENLSAFLKASQPRNDDMQNAIFDLPVDVALLERAISEVSRMKGLESRGAAILDENPMLYLFDNSEIKPSPCLKLLKLQYLVAEFVRAVYRQDEPQIPNKETSYIAISRKNYRVFFYEIEEWQWCFLSALKDSGIYLDAISSTSLQCRISTDMIMADLMLWLPVALECEFVYR
jgi:hypothetical protein